MKEIELPEKWEICENKNHWLEILIYGKCN